MINAPKTPPIAQITTASHIAAILIPNKIFAANSINNPRIAFMARAMTVLKTLYKINATTIEISNNIKGSTTINYSKEFNLYIFIVKSLERSLLI
jgi:hypothetical protein